MGLDEIGRFIATVGFPAAVTAFLLLKLNGTLGGLKDAVKENTRVTKAMTKMHTKKR